MNISLTDFLQRPSSSEGGRSVIEHRGLEIPCYFEDRGHHTTFVTFSGALTPDVTELPAFVGWGTTRHLKANVLILSDPSLALDPKLRLGWYAGSKQQPDLQSVLTRVIRAFACKTRVVMFGASGGGFAALEQATRLPGSIALVSNPQTDILRYHERETAQYLHLAWRAGLSESASLPFRHEVVTAYANPVDARVIYVQNNSDAFHISNHEEPFRAALHPDNEVIWVRGDFGDGHIGPDKELFAQLFSAVTNEKRWAYMAAEI